MVDKSPHVGLSNARRYDRRLAMHALTFDVEDWFHLDGIPSVEDRHKWDEFPSLVERRTDQFLGLCEEADTHATFFVLGWVAERRPELVPRILAAGHEVASHSYWHRTVPTLTPESFDSDVRQSVAVLQAQGATVEGFRAPCFSIDHERDRWALDVLADVGLRYDASILDAGRGPHVVRTTGGGSVVEIPMSQASMPLLRVGRLRYSGGGYLRLLPLWAVQMGLRQEWRAGRGTVVYLHPRDLAPDCPRVAMTPVRRLRTYAGLGTTARKVRALLREHRFRPCREIAREVMGQAVSAER